MIIGIDETGNFDETSELRHFFIAAFIETENGKLEKKEKQFLNWERSLPLSVKNSQGEVKGSFLNIVQLQSFIHDVAFEPPLIRTSFVSIVPSNNPFTLIEKYRLFEIRQAEYNYQMYLSKGSKKRNINFLDNYVKWLKKRSVRDYLKMSCLKHLLKDTFHNAVVLSILNDRIEETLNFSYKIDRDFLTEENIFWEHYSRMSIRNYTQRNPFPVLDTWDDNHPFIKKYLLNDDDKSGININLIYKNLKFLNSKDHFEIRIADLIGIIINRFYNKGQMPEEHTLLTLAGATNESHIELRLQDFDEESTFKEYVENGGD